MGGHIIKEVYIAPAAVGLNRGMMINCIEEDDEVPVPRQFYGQ